MTDLPRFGTSSPLPRNQVPPARPPVRLATWPLAAALALLPASALVQASFVSLDQEVFKRFFNSDGWGTGAADWVDGVTVPTWHAMYTTDPADPHNTSTVIDAYRATSGGVTSPYGLYVFRPAEGDPYGTLGTRSWDGTSGPVDVGGIYIGTEVVNDTGAPITSFSLGYTGEQWQVRTGDDGTFVVSYSTDADSLISGSWDVVDDLLFTSPRSGSSVTTNGRTIEQNRVVFRPMTLELDEPLMPGESLWVRWFSVNAPGADQSIGIDEIRITANPVPKFNADFTLGTDPDPNNHDWDYTDRVIQVGEGVGQAGSITVPDGQTLQFYDLYLGAADATASGSLTVTGSDAAAISSRDTGFGSVLSVGYDGMGVVTVSEGGTLSSRGLRLAVMPGSEGTVTVAGAGSTLTSPTETVDVNGTPTEELTHWDLFIGQEGTGTLNVLDGAVVEGNRNVLVGYSGTAEGTLLIAGGASLSADAHARIADLAGSVGTVTVTGADSNLELGSYLYVGSGGDGTMVVSDGAQVFADGTVQIAAGLRDGEENATGFLHVTGAGSHISNTDIFYVGRHGEATMLVEDGGSAFTTGSFRVGRESASVGTLTVRDAGSSVTSDNYILVGEDGHGIVHIENGGQVTTTGSISIARQEGSRGDVEIRGAGSEMHSDSFFHVGRLDQGTLLVESGGLARSGTYMTLGSAATGDGTVTVIGTDSQVTTATYLRVGNSGPGTMSVLDGAQAEVGTDLIVGGSAIGTLLIQGPGSAIHASENFNLNQGTVTLETGGHLQVDLAASMAGPSTLHLEGGTLAVDGLFEANADSTLSFLLAAPGFQGVSAGDVLFDGTTLTLGLGFQPEIDDLFVLIDVSGGGSITGNLAYDGSLLGEGDMFLVTDGLFEQYFQITYAHDGNSLALAAVIPEPATWAALFGLGALGLVLLRRRRG